MTVALCLNCGEMKWGAWCACAKCGFEPPIGSQLDLLLSDHNYTEAALKELGTTFKEISAVASDTGQAQKAFAYYLSQSTPDVLQISLSEEEEVAFKSLLASCESLGPAPKMSYEGDDDEPVEDQRAQFLQERPPIPEGSEPLPECDELEGASGVLGFTPSNPIPVNGPFGVSVYLSRLRTDGGTSFLWHRLGAVDSDVCPTSVDEYELVAVDASAWHKLYFSLGHPRRSRYAPPGFTLVSWHRMRPNEQMLAKAGSSHGANERVQSFPYGLPDVIGVNLTANHINPILANALACGLEKIISEHADDWYAHPSCSPERQKEGADRRQRRLAVEKKMSRLFSSLRTSTQTEHKS